MTHPRFYFYTRTATAVADLFKAQRLDRLVATIRKSALCTLILGGGKAFTKLPPDAVARLSELFRPEVEELEALLGRDLANWKYPETSLTCVA